MKIRFEKAEKQMIAELMIANGMCKRKYREKST